jgi:hypothetical protein
MFWMFLIVSLGILVYDIVTDPKIKEKLKEVEE